MLKIITIIIVYLISIVSFAQNSLETTKISSSNKNFNVTAVVNNIASDKGIVLFAIFDSEDSFKNKIPLASKNILIKNGEATVTFKELNPNTYAIICYHDANSNGKMDFQENGMPLEDYGATNNVLNYGPPRFNDAKFEVTNKDLTFEIKF